MSGPEVCRAIRTTDYGRYVYVILLTSLSDKADLVAGLNAGADDFLSKPFDAQGLRARLRVAERILALEDRLAEQNRILQDSRDKLEQAYDQIQTDVESAARVQRQMLPTSDETISPWRAGRLFIPAAQVSGDNFNYFEITEDVIGFYHLDVSGHGIPAAFLSASLSRALMPGSGASGSQRASFLDPAQFLADLNTQLTNRDGVVENYATMAYGIADRSTGIGSLAVAGHPHPFIVRAAGTTEQIKCSGLPVGMFPMVSYEAESFELAPGDKLVLYSDGVTECENPAEVAFGDAQFRACMSEQPDAPAQQLAVGLKTLLENWRDRPEFEDDVSVLVMERPATGSSTQPPATSKGETP